MSSWNIILCGHLPNTIIVSVTDPAKWTVDNLKQVVIKDVPKASKSDITFYASENEQIPEGVPLKECAGVRNGTGLLTSIKPFIIKVYSPDVDDTVTVEIPIREFDDWILSNLLQAIHFKFGASGNDDLLVFNGKLLGDDPKAKVSLIPDISSDCVMTYTRFRIGGCFLSPQNTKVKVFIPGGIGSAFVKNHCFYRRDLDGKSFIPPWHVVVQQLDGSKTTLALNDPHKISVIDLRKVVQQELSIPPHQQKLLLRDDVVLEDWKTTSDGKMLITNYPSFIDGAKLYVVHLTGGIRVNVSETDKSNRYQIRRVVGSINIHDRSLWTLQKLTLVMTTLYTSRPRSDVVYLHSTTTGVPQAMEKSFSPSDELVSSVDWITDNCTLTFDK